VERLEKSTTTAMLTPAQCAARLAIDVDGVRALIRAGNLEAVDVGRGARKRPRYRVSQSALESFLERRTVRPPNPANRRQHRRRETQVIEFF
jgi:excisionase family DNA binding protein